jgi:hypothetical protein
MGSMTGLGTLKTLANVVSTAAPMINSSLRVYDNIQNRSQSDGAARQALALQQQQLAAQQNLALAQLQAQQNLDSRKLSENIALEKQTLATNSAATEEARRQALKRAMARQKVSFASQGVSAGDGSAEAILLGLYNESEADKATRTHLDDLKVKALDNNLSHNAQMDLLERTQMIENQRLKSAFLS